jgi:hypothetical protein
MNFNKFLKTFIIFLLVFSWIFSGWPQIWKKPPIPPKIQEAKAQGLYVKVGSFAKITTTGTQTITGLGFQPKAIIFYWSRNTANATAQVPRSQGIGFTDCVNQRAVAIAEDDNAGTSNAGRYRTESNVIVILSNGGPTVGSRATFTSCDADGFTIDWAESEARADIINYIAIGGPDVTNVKAGTFTLAASTGIQNITGVGFQPDFAMFLWGFTEALDSLATGLEMGMGFADYSNNQGSILNCVKDAEATNRTKYSQQRTDNVILLSSTACAQDALAAFNGFTADGFSLNVSDAPAAATPIFYLAIKGGSHAVGNFLQPTATGVQTISGTGFQPNLVVLFSHNQAAGTALAAPSTFSIGAANATTSRAGVWGQSKNVDPSNAAVYTDNTKIIIMRTLSKTGGVGTINAQADFYGFTSDGFQLNWTTADATQRQIIYWAFGPSPTFNQSAYRFFNNLDSTDVGTPLANQDTAATLTSAGQAFRLRLLLHVTNKLALNGQSFKLQFAQRGADGLCDTGFSGETYADVTTSTVIAYNDNPTPTDGSALTANSNDPTHGTDTIVNQTYEELNNFTNSVAAISSGQDGKWDFSLRDNGAPASTTYCFRVVKSDGTLLNAYSVIPQITTAAPPANQPPTVSNVSLNGGNAINLTENTTTTVSCTATLSDPNGGADITSATATIYRSGVGPSCTPDDNNCYQIASSSCILGTVAGNDRPATCTADIWFHADPTDVGPYSAETWMCTITAIDSGGLTGSSSTATGVEMNTLLALDVTLQINYGTMLPGDTIDPLSITSTVTTTGNAAIDVQLSGTDMTSGANSISVSQQRYATSTVAYSSGYTLTTTPTLLELTTGKPTAHPSNQAQNIYWGIQIPLGTPMGSYSGQITFTAVAD